MDKKDESSVQKWKGLKTLLYPVKERVQRDRNVPWAALRGEGFV